MIKKKLQKNLEVSFKDPYHRKDLQFKVIPIENLIVVQYQRKPSIYHTKHLSSSIERIGFIVPIIVIEDGEENYTIIDGQHRYLAAKELGIRELPAIVVPQELSQLMMNLNIEKELNIREKSYVAVAIYRKYLLSQPEMIETDPEIIDSIEQIYYVTLGIAYEQQDKLAGSSFEPLLKKSDSFLDEKLNEAFIIRQKRAEIIIATNDLIKEIAQKLKEIGKWHPYIYQQIISFANPYKRKKLLTDFDELFEKILDNLKSIKNNPEIVLAEKLAEF